MGLMLDGLTGHEGFLVGFVRREGCSPGSGIVRELGYPDAYRGPVSLIAAGCDCGWRSPRWVPMHAEYSPHSIFASQPDEAKRERLWMEHAHHQRLQEGR